MLVIDMHRKNCIPTCTLGVGEDNPSKKDSMLLRVKGHHPGISIQNRQNYPTAQQFCRETYLKPLQLRNAESRDFPLWKITTVLL